MKINDKKLYAILQLKQVAFINVSIYFSKTDICKKLISISDHPDNVTFCYNPDLKFQDFRLKRDDVPELFTEKGFGHYANKMIIVYSASILENFLFEIAYDLQIGKVEKI